jgi:hypothetical protein
MSLSLLENQLHLIGPVGNLLTYRTILAHKQMLMFMKSSKKSPMLGFRVLPAIKLFLCRVFVWNGSDISIANRNA